MSFTLTDLLDLLEIEEIEQNIFRGQNETAQRTRLFGGQVAAQALAAAGRTVEARDAHSLHAYFLRPGSAFRVVDALLTNFHLPRSSLLLLVAGFAGRERILAAYREAIEREYRFYSYGDAMLIL